MKVCKRCKHFPVHKADHSYYGSMQLCLFAMMLIDCRRWELWR